MAYHPKWMTKPIYDANEDNLVDDSDKVDGADAGTAANNVFKIPSDIAQGDIFYVDGTGNVARLPAGTAGQFLQTQGAGADPQWAFPPSGEGIVKQRLSISAGESFTVESNECMMVILPPNKKFSIDGSLKINGGSFILFSL